MQFFHQAGNHLSFWKYPEDESKSELKTETIDLSTCITDDVTLAPRNISSRMNTIMLETRRPKRQGDKESELNIMTLVNLSSMLRVRDIQLFPMANFNFPIFTVGSQVRLHYRKAPALGGHAR